MALYPIYRYSTQDFTIKLPFNTSELSNVWVTFTQNKNIIIDKTLDNGDLSLEKDKIYFSLTQEETAMLMQNSTFTVQVRVLTTDGKSIPSKPYTQSIFNVLKEGIITANG